MLFPFVILKNFNFSYEREKENLKFLSAPAENVAQKVKTNRKKISFVLDQIAKDGNTKQNRFHYAKLSGCVPLCIEAGMFLKLVCTFRQ